MIIQFRTVSTVWNRPIIIIMVAVIAIGLLVLACLACLALLLYNGASSSNELANGTVMNIYH